MGARCGVGSGAGERDTCLFFGGRVGCSARPGPPPSARRPGHPGCALSSPTHSPCPRTHPPTHSLTRCLTLTPHTLQAEPDTPLSISPPRIFPRPSLTPPSLSPPPPGRARRRPRRQRLMAQRPFRHWRHGAAGRNTGRHVHTAGGGHLHLPFHLSRAQGRVGSQDHGAPGWREVRGGGLCVRSHRH